MVMLPKCCSLCLGHRVVQPVRDVGLVEFSGLASHLAGPVIVCLGWHNDTRVRVAGIDEPRIATSGVRGFTNCELLAIARRESPS